MILRRLKQETRADHDRIERALDLVQLCRSVEAYRRLLERYLGFYAPVEAALGRLEALDSLGVDLERRRKAGLLERDLAALGLSERDLVALPRCMDLPDLTSPTRALGCLYVLEGATLGGQIIARQLLPALGLSAAAGGSFFSSYGASVGPMWRAFGERLVACATTPEAEAEIVAGARQAFGSFTGWVLLAAPSSL